MHLVLGEDVLLAADVEGEVVLDLVVEDAAVEEAGRALGLAHGRNGEAGVVEGLLVPLELEPPLAHVEAVDHLIALERMVEVASLRPPVDELDGQLVGGVAARHPFGLVEAEEVEEELDGAEGRLADAHGLDVGRLDQSDVHSRQRLLQVRRRHPPRRPAPHDHDALSHGLDSPER